MPEATTLSRSDLERAARENQIPDHLIDGLVSYAVDRRPTGGFLNAVLCNDLREACARADAKSMAALPRIVQFIYHHLPADCWGSRMMMSTWLYPQK